MKWAHSSICTLAVELGVESWRMHIYLSCLSQPFLSPRQENRVHTPIALHDMSHLHTLVAEQVRWWLLLEEIASRLNARDQGVWERDAGSDQIMLQPSTLPVQQPDRLCEIVVKYEGMIERIEQEDDAANLNDDMLSNVDKKYAPEDGESETAVQDAVDELLKNPVAENGELDRTVRDTENNKWPSGERMADAVIREGVAEKHDTLPWSAETRDLRIWRDWILVRKWEPKCWIFFVRKSRSTCSRTTTELAWVARKDWTSQTIPMPRAKARGVKKPESVTSGTNPYSCGRTVRPKKVEREGKLIRYWTVVHVEQRVGLVTCLMCQQKTQRWHWLRLMDFPVTSVSKRKCIGRNVIRLVRRDVLSPRW